MNKYTHRRIWLLERSLAKSLGKVTHSAAVSLPMETQAEIQFGSKPRAGLL